MEWRPHSELQERATFSDRKITALLTGIQFGKTTVGAVRQKLRMHTHVDPSDAFIIAAPTYKIMQQSTLPAFLKIMRDCGHYNKSDAVFTLNGGGTCYMRTGTEPDSVVGITNVRGIWLDEGGKVSRYFWDNLMARAAFRDCPVDITSSPYTLNWVYKDIVRPKQRDPSARPDVALIQAASIDNPLFPRSEWDRNRLTMDPRRFKMVFGGGWDRPVGIVYDCFDDDLNICQPFELPPGTKFVGGLDWGFTDPFVFKIRAITPSGAHYGVAEVYQTGLTIDRQSEEVARLCALYPVGAIYADPSRPDSILGMNQALKKAGLKASVQPANNDRRIGIDRHYELIKTRRMKYFAGMNRYTLDEIESYHYPEPEELDADDNSKDQLPVEQNDHAMDAERYISISTYRAMGDEKRAPFVPEEKQASSNHAERIEQRKRRPMRNNTEKWSA